MIAHKISLVRTKPLPLNTNNRGWVHKPSLQHHVLLGNNLINLRTMSTSITRGATKNMVVGLEGGDLYRCLSPKTSIIALLYRATLDDPNTFTAVAKCPSTALRKYCLILWPFFCLHPQNNLFHNSHHSP